MIFLSCNSYEHASILMFPTIKVLPVHMGDDSDSEEEEEEDELDYGMPTSDSIDDFVSTANSTSVGGKISTYTGGSSSGSTHSSSSSSSSSQNGSSSSQSRGHDGSFISHGFSFSTAGERTVQNFLVSLRSLFSIIYHSHQHHLSFSYLMT